MLGCSFIINHTQIGPIIVSKRKKRLTSSAGINLGAIVTKTKGIATHIIHIRGINILSLPIRAKLSTKKNANIAKSICVRRVLYDENWAEKQQHTIDVFWNRNDSISVKKIDLKPKTGNQML